MKSAHLDPAALTRQLSDSRSTDRNPAGGDRTDLDACGEFAIRIGRDGVWFYHGSPIGRKPLVQLFARVLHCDEAGVYRLVTPVESGRIVVDDLPFVAVALEVRGSGRGQDLIFRTNLDETVTADAAHPIRVVSRDGGQGPAPSILVRDRLEARIARTVFYDLVALAVPGDDPHIVGVWSAGAFFPLGGLT